LAARYTGVAGVLSDTQRALDASGLRSRNVAGDALDLGVVETIEGNLVVGPKKPEFCTDGAGGAAVRSADDQQSKENAEHQHAGSENEPQFPQHVFIFPFAGIGVPIPLARLLSSL